MLRARAIVAACRLVGVGVVLGVGCGDARPPPSGDPSGDSGEIVGDAGIAAWRCPSGPSATDGGAGPTDAGDAGADAEQPAPVEPPRIGIHQWTRADVAEANLLMDAGAVATACFRATGPVRWDVHGHDGPDVIVFERGEAQSAEITFRAPTDGLYSFGWSRIAGPTGVSVILVGGGKLETWSP